MNVKNIIFDLGGVILNLDMNRTLTALEKLAGKAIEINLINGNPLFEAYESGLITSQEFLNGLRDFVGQSPTDEQIIEAWNAMLLDLPQERIDLLRTIAQEKRIFLLSNTNEIHLNAFQKIVKAETDLQILDEVFEKAYYSYQMFDRKPKASIFQTVLNNHQLLPSETLFIDDTEIHIKTAQMCQIQTFHLKKPLTLFDLFDKNGKIKS